MDSTSQPKQSTSEFARHLLTAQNLVDEGNSAAALEYYQKASAFADSDFEKSYLYGEMAELLVALGRFDEAVEVGQKAVNYAEQVPWPDFIATFHFELANLYCHLGRFQESESHYRRLLEIQPQLSQSLAVALMEQAKYGEALSLLKESKHFFETQESPEQVIIRMQLAQVYYYLGMVRAGRQEIAEAKEILVTHELAQFWPYLNFLEGRFESVQGSLVKAFRIFEEAARGFEKNGDLVGKVEVLLAISAPLLELSLLQEAQRLVGQMVSWEELKKFPALQHSVQLRRLALGAFSGKWTPEDIDLLTTGTLEVGRTEDWLQFWLHLFLAARKLKQNTLAANFLSRAKSIADEIYSRLNEEQRAYFVRRPDMARLLRLTSALSTKEGQQIRAERKFPVEGPAEPATVAPPISPKPKKKL